MINILNLFLNHKILRMPELKYKINNDNIITIPSNMDKEINIDKYIYGYDRYKKKMKLLKFYLNPITFQKYGDTDLMTDMIKKYDVNKFIQYTLLMVSTTPELFTINNSHHVMSILLNLAVNNIEKTNTRNAYISYNKILSYLKSNELCHQLYGIEKSILTIQPLKIKEKMNQRTKDIVTIINTYLTENDMYTGKHQATDTEKNELNDIMELSETESESGFEWDITIKDKESDKERNEANNLDKYIDITTVLDMPKPVTTSILKPVRPAPSPPINITSIPFKPTYPPPSYPPPPPPRTCSELQYHKNTNPIHAQSLFNRTLTTEQTEKIQSSGLLDVVQQVRIKGKMLVLKKPFPHQNLNSAIDPVKVLNNLPTPISNLCINWLNHLVLAGGYLSNLHIGTKCMSSDIDIFILDMDDETYNKFNNNLIEALRLMDITYNARAIQMKSVLTIVSKFQHNIQFIRTNKKDLRAVIEGFDILNCGLGINYYGIGSRCDDGPLMIDTTNFNQRTYTRIIKYLAKGFKLENYDDMINNKIVIDKVIEASKQEDITNTCTKHCNPFVNDSSIAHTEDELRQKIIKDLKGKYIGNHFEEIKLDKFNFKQCYYNSHKTSKDFAKNIEVMDNFDEINLIKHDYGKTESMNRPNYSLYRADKPYYLKFQINTAHLEVKQSFHDILSGNSGKDEETNLKIDLTNYPDLIKQIKSFEKALCNKLNIEYPDNNEKCYVSMINDSKIYLVTNKSKLNKQINNKYTTVPLKGNIETDRQLTFRIGFKHLYEHITKDYRGKISKTHKVKFQLFGDVYQSNAEHPSYINLLKMNDYNELKMTGLNIMNGRMPNGHIQYPLKEYVLPLQIYTKDYRTFYDDYSKKYNVLINLAKYPNEMKKIKDLQNKLYNDEFANKIIEAGIYKRKSTDDSVDKRTKFIDSVSYDIIKERITKNKKGITKTYQNFSISIDEEQYEQLNQLKKEGPWTVSIYANLKFVFIGHVISVKFNISRNIKELPYTDLIDFDSDTDSDTDYETEL
jgi:hypothetical protein